MSNACIFRVDFDSTNRFRQTIVPQTTFEHACKKSVHILNTPLCVMRNQAIMVLLGEFWTTPTPSI